MKETDFTKVIIYELITELVKENGNDAELGKKVRKVINNIKNGN
jgi:hypothetical protein